jgi:hypothetical protein
MHGKGLPPEPEPVPGALRELKELFLRVRTAFDENSREVGGRPVTNRQIAQLAYRSSQRHSIPGRPTWPLAKAPADSHISGVLRGVVIPGPGLAFHIVKGLSGSQQNATRAYQLAERSRDERGKGSADGNAEPTPSAPGASPGNNLRAVVEAILAHLVPSSKPGRRGNLPLAVELALSRAIAAFGTGKGRVSLVWPLLDPDGFLAEPEVAALLAQALTGGYPQGAPSLGRAWARAFLDGTRADELTAEATDLLDSLWEQAQELRSLADLAEARLAREPAAPANARAARVPRSSPRERPPNMQASELQARLARAREFIADFDRVAASDIGKSGRNLPPELRGFLRDQTHIVASGSRGFVGREAVLKEVKAFAEGDEDGYFFVRAKLGVGKTALLAHLVADQPGYARHFNVLSEGVFTAEQFLDNVCAQLIGSYRLDPGLFPKSGNASGDLLRRLLEQSAAKARGDNVVVLIDALDEAKMLPAVNPLSLPTSLPEGCRFIVTIRDETGRDAAGAWRAPLVADCAKRDRCIDAGGEENMDDARTYVRNRLLASPRITDYLRTRKHGLTVEEFTSEVARRSEGYFVYLKHVLDQYEAGGHLATRELAALPIGLMPYYKQQFERMRADTPKPEWEKIQRPVLIQLANAERPLTRFDLAARAGLREPGRVQSALDQWRQYVVETNGAWNGRPRPAYRLFHESFREFLSKELPDAAEVAEEERALRADLGGRAPARYGRWNRPRPL